MKLQSYYATLGLVAVSAVAGCTVNSTSTGPDDAAVDNADTSTSTGNPEDSGTTDTATTTPEDTGTTPGADASDAAAATCSVALDTGSADCDSCVATSCCTQLTNCVATDDAGTDDAGNSACLQLLVCINDVNSTSDAGVDAGVGETTCDPSYTSTEQTTAEAVLTCIRTSCSTQCPGL